MKTGDFLRNLVKGVAGKVPRSTAILAGALITIFFIGLLIRLAPIFLYEPLLKEFDPWFFYRSVQYIIQNGFGPWFTWHDLAAWTPYGRDVAASTYPGMVFTAVFIYSALNQIGIQVSAFTVCYYFPVLFGSLTPLVTYFLGKEAYDRRSGIIAAFFIAVSPAIIQRQVAGFFDNEAFGIFLMLCTFYFYVRALKRDSIPSAVMAGLFLGFVCISWGILRYVLDILALYTFVMLLLRRYSMKLFNTSAITLLLGLFISVLAPRNGVGLLEGGDVLPTVFVLGLLIAYEGTKYLAKIPFLSKIGKRIVSVNPFLLLAVGALGVLFILVYSPMTGKFATLLIPIFRETQAAILASVGEHLPSVWASFYQYLGIALALSILGLYFSFRRLNDIDIFMILSTLTLVYFSGSMIRIIVTLSPILAIVSGYGLSRMLSPFSKIMRAPQEEMVQRKRMRLTPAVGREYSAVAFLMIGLILFGYGTTIVSLVPGSKTTTLLQTMSPPEILAGGSYEDWLEACTWMNNVAPSNSVIAAWWDYGYYITCIGNRTSIDDNGTGNSTQIALVGLAFMETNETASLQILKRFNTKYVLTFFGFMQSGLGGDEGKWLWMLRIAADHFGSQGLINKTLYYNETSQIIYPLFYNTTLYRLMYNGEPHQTGLTSNTITWSDYLVLYMGTSNSTRRMATEPFPAVNPNENALTTANSYLASQTGFKAVTVIDPYGPRFFKPAFISSNHFVKIYEVDYTPLEMSENLSIDTNATKLYNNGTAVITVNNTGGASLPAIPLNTFTDSAGRKFNGSIWLNNSYQVSTQPLQIWNGTTWNTHFETYYVSPGQSVTFRVSGLNTTMLTRAFTNSTRLSLRFVTAYDKGVYTTAEVPVIAS